MVKTKKLSRQKEILLSLIQGSDGKSWAENRVGWSEDTVYDVCLWDGIDCDPDNHNGVAVTGIFLPAMSIKASIPSTLSKLSWLEELTLASNEIYGTIPDSISQLPKLKVINLSNNQLSGTIPLFTSKKLKEVILKTNNFSGNLPEQNGDKLINYDVCENDLTGTIPESFSKMKSITALTLSENELSGTIPSSLGKLIPLKFLFLDHNNFMGTIPPSLTRSNSKLEEIWLHENQLSGTLPASVGELDFLFNFYVDGNKLTGSVPLEVCYRQLNKDFFESNENIPFLERDYCDSVACPIGKVSKKGVYPCIDCHLKYYNPYLGRVGECIDLNQIAILKFFHDATGGKNWYTTSTIISGEEWSFTNETSDLSVCTWMGISCDNDNNIIGINLKNVGLVGTIPEQIGFLRFLSFLDLSDNKLTGFIPSDLRWAPLESLDIGGNKLRGIVPPSLCFKEGINRNGEKGHFDCKYIACPVGYFSSSGNESPINTCKKCKYGNSYLGGKECFVQDDLIETTKHFETTDDHHFLTKSLYVIFSFIALGAIIAFRELKKLSKEDKQKGYSYTPGLHKIDLEKDDNIII